MRTALITGASRGLGLALATDLAAAGWRLVLDARGAADLDTAAAGVAAAAAGAARPGTVVAIAGDVTDPPHRRELAAAVGDRLDLLVHNASSLGTTPLPPLADYDPAALRAVLETNVVAPLALTQLVLPALRSARGRVLAVSSDAAVAAYPGWGGYGASKAALDRLAAVLDAEEPLLRVYAVDPGDMRTAMHAAAFPGEDISDRPEPATVLPALRRLIEADLPPGRWTAAGPTAPEPTAAGPTAPGPTAAGPTAPGPTAAGPTAAGPTAAGLTAPGPTAAGLTAAGPTAAGLTAAGPTAAGLTAPGPTAPEPTAPGPIAPGPTAAGPVGAGVPA